MGKKCKKCGKILKYRELREWPFAVELPHNCKPQHSTKTTPNPKAGKKRHTPGEYWWEKL